jgi:hypothetical protein
MCFIYSLAFKIPIMNKECREYLETHIQTRLVKEPTLTLPLTPKPT